jgi:hypothetical protein
MVTNNTARTSNAIADSGCTGHFLQVNSPCLNRTPTSNGLRVLLPDGSTIQATHTALLDMPNLPLAARQAHIFPQLKHNGLISISQFCDLGCTALFTSTDVQILVNSTTIIRGSRQPTTGLWTIDLNNQPNLNTPAWFSHFMLPLNLYLVTYLPFLFWFSFLFYPFYFAPSMYPYIFFRIPFGYSPSMISIF